MIQFKQYFNRNVLVESFIDSKNKWIQQGIDPTEVELAIDFYRGLKTRNIIKGQEADIGFWMSKSFEEFNSFINQFKNVKTKTQVKKEIGQDAEKVFENDRAVVIVPKTHAASCKYGAGTKWCTTSKESKHWDQYIENDSKFYYILTKDMPVNDRYYKVAVAVYLGGKLEVYDAIDDEISTNMFEGFIATYNIPENIFTNIFDPKKYLERFDHTIDKNGYITINGSFHGSHLNLTKLPWKFKEVSGAFDCSRNKLTSLEGAPQTVDGGFYCDDNKLTTLKGAPQTVGNNFYCFRNQLTTLKGAPQTVGGTFHCSDNKLTTLNGVPQIVGNNFYCSGNITKFTKNIVLKYTKVNGEIYT